MAVCTVLYGADTQVGVTMLTQALAEYLADKGANVLLIVAGQEPGNAYLPATFSASLDDIKSEMRAGLTAAAVAQAVGRYRGLDVLGAVRSPASAGTYRADDMRHLILAADGLYDHILIDAGSGQGAVLAESALLCGQRRFLVVTQQEKTLCRAEGRLARLRQRSISGFSLLVNKWNESSAFYDERQILQRLGAAGRVETEEGTPEDVGAGTEGETGVTGTAGTAGSAGDVEAAAGTGHDADAAAAMARDEKEADEPVIRSEKVFRIPFVPYGWQAEMDRETMLRYRPFRRCIARLASAVQRPLPSGMRG